MGGFIDGKNWYVAKLLFNNKSQCFLTPKGAKVCSTFLAAGLIMGQPWIIRVIIDTPQPACHKRPSHRAWKVVSYKL